MGCMQGIDHMPCSLLIAGFPPDSQVWANAHTSSGGTSARSPHDCHQDAGGQKRAHSHRWVSRETRPWQGRVGYWTQILSSAAGLTYSDGSCRRDRRCGELRKLNTITADVASISVMGTAFILALDKRKCRKSQTESQPTDVISMTTTQAANAIRRCRVPDSLDYLKVRPEVRPQTCTASSVR